MVGDYSTMPAAERDAFGNWLSGFTDGEGCFYLGITRTRHPYTFPLVRFDIVLRYDDRSILETIQSFWGAGFIGEHAERGPSKLKSKLSVCKTSDLVSIVRPHFETYPLRAKKNRDFIIWKRGLELCDQVRRRRKRRAAGGRNGTLPLWTPDELELFKSYVMALREQRKFETAHAVILADEIRGDQQQLTLFT